MFTGNIEEQGFSILSGAVASDEIENLLDHLNGAPLKRSRAGIRHALQHPAIANFARAPHILGEAERILGNEAFPYRATLFHKSQTANWLVVWHQDTALPLQERRETTGWGPWSVKDGVVYAHAPTSALKETIALRVHLDDSTAQNGPLRALPGSHKQGVLSDDVIHQLALKVPAVECIVPKGGILAMSPLLVHSSSKSQLETMRRVLHIEYASRSTPLDGLRLAIA